MSAAQCPQQRGFHKWLVTHMMPIAMASNFHSALRLGNPYNYVLDKTKSINRRLVWYDINLPFLNRSSITAKFSAFTFLGNGNYHVTVFITGLVLFKPRISEVGGKEPMLYLGDMRI